ncbi:carbamoyl-phosphate synthase large chain [Arenicella chitinivorans]|uniref:Carbamoyl phosphate synthase large chain n=1 Tax=Arenicella chitinivorans TaxID=1329800 RepID=A0A918VI76_9GAMM|nr:carbamoyl-phosphate synthase large subunit [Arenicella chitinivorans]GGZ99493.1 carbamoyl-phosphate synthase large chain [Arenicella chitinivorans]
MPKRSDIQTVLIIGAGPIIIGQACEFDYSGVQACKALKEEGFRVVLVNSNPATIMTDPGFADATYIEPISWQAVEKIIEAEKPDVLLPTMGGQTALNCALDLEREGVLAKHGVEMIGATKEAIDKAEDREKFKSAMTKIGLETVRGDIAHSMDQAFEILEDLGLPVIIRPSFTMGGTGGGIAYNKAEFVEICQRGLDASPTNELLIEECIFGWKEYEMEVVRDREDNCIIICSIENFDAMGVHTGDSITVAPAQTLTDKEYQIMRDASLAVLREIGVDTGGSNVQFAVDPKTGRMIIIEMNPRVSRSSALASKATGFPIAKVAAKLAVGYTLDELRNEITGGLTPASFEPSIDYVVTKIPRFDFVKFPQADDTLTTQMKSVGEAMAIGRTFQESLQKAMRSLEIGSHGFEPQLGDLEGTMRETRLSQALRVPKAERLWYIGDAFREGMSVQAVHEATGIEPWFLAEIADLMQTETDVAEATLAELTKEQVFSWKRKGFSDVRLSQLLACSEDDFRAQRHALSVRPVYKRVDSCAAEFATATAYMYSSYEQECEAEPVTTDKIMVLGGGPNRIGQGIEFDYCCVHAAMALRDNGYQTIMVNCNPETVSTDYDTSDRLYFEPLTLEDVLEIVHKENPTGVIVQYGGQTPLKLARPLEAQGTPIIGTSPTAIHDAEDREQFQALLNRLNLKQPPNRIASSEEDALEMAEEVGYPLVVRPSYVLGGRAMEIVHDTAALKNYMASAIQVSNESPVLLDRFLNDAIEVDVDAICDGEQVVIGGIMEHIEQAGVHSGDSACSLPPFSLTEAIKADLREQTAKMALALNVVGLMNVQFAIKGEDIFVLEVNPRASRTVPFVSKATSRPLAKVAALCMAGKSLAEQGIQGEIIPEYYSVKEAVFPFVKFPGVDTLLGPEMKSTGEVMGVGRSFGEAYDKAQQGTGSNIPHTGTVLFSVRNSDKKIATELASYLSGAGFDIVATRGTAQVFRDAGIETKVVNKVKEGRPHIVDMIIDGQANLVINTTSSNDTVKDSYTIRREALMHKVTYFTNISSARAMVAAHKAHSEMSVSKLQDLHKLIKHN